MIYSLINKRYYLSGLKREEVGIQLKKTTTGLTLTERDQNPAPDELWANYSAILNIYFIFVIYGHHLPKCTAGKCLIEANNF